ncbi:T9SS type B sorting domain-containing protein [Flavobacterium caeni]|uniref:Gliding motility-associated C-terminal domain-containing protein n=1 Tax=Flavobacterium caeni TaxID=490189 RepID=A0A1G5CXD1_9FLAO|nr:T9SS type B sorting domain-containing protein [Flavobacterium caeni]SCY07072.1 gliding motility-associated C-terminal domain-containing protein [Flavobacterium caeni]
MKKLFLLVSLISFGLQAQVYNMQNGSVTTCSGTFYDSGGAAGDYGILETYQMTFCPPSAGSYIQLNFTQFDIEGQPFDYMTIYNGPNTSGTIIGTYGDTAPAGCDVIASSHASGCITVVFVSDGSIEYSGWAATISCTNTPGGVPIPIPSNAVCSGASPFCADAGPLEFPNIQDGCAADAPADVTTYTCLFTAPNPAWYFLEVDIPGNINLEIEQTTGPNGTGTGLDVDYAIWGPFSNAAAACADFTQGTCAGDHLCFGNVIDCSYDPAAIETATIPNAQVGQIYMVLITNFDGDPGYISMTQTNAGSPGAGSTDCSIVCPTFAGTNPTTCGGTNGSIAISGLDSNTNYTVSYLDDGTPSTANVTSNAAGVAVITGLNAGNYTNLATNYVGCTAAFGSVVLTSTTAPTASISYPAGPYCNSSAVMQNVTLTGTGSFTGGTYSSAAGLSLSPTTGAINPAASTAGTYTVTYTIAASGGCPQVTATASVTISGTGTASIAYAGPYCTSTAVVQNPTLTGTGAFTGGTYTSTVGLNINASTGAVNPSLSTAGTYTVTYSIAASGGCPAITATAPVTISAPATANIAYASPFCTSNATAQNPTLTGTGSYTGGTYSSTAGLSINATTGAINASLSTAGTYTVTYSIAAAGGCPAVNATASVTISAPATANIAYTSPYCTSDATAQNPTLTGTGSYTGGTYSSTAGLSINAATGAINASLSTAGTYTVTYSITAAGGCPAVNATASVTISAPATATIVYTSPYCTSDATAQNPTLTGTGSYTGGTYSSTAGLSINAITGAINASLSTAGTYTVTYSIAAAGGCPAVNATASVTISAPATANIVYTGPYCTSDATAQNPTLTGTGSYTGGAYSSTAGLSINATTGAINASLSTAGTYTVTYSIAAAGGCPAVNATALVTISAPATANIAYTGPYCTSDATAQNPTLTGTGSYTGGTYSSTAGLSINAATGAINASLSTAGTYTVTYSIAATGGCPAVNVTASVTISAPATASITYTDPFCATDTTLQSVTLTGTGSFAGGSFSAPAGLSINATNGAINPSLSTVGTHTVTYTILASGGCSVVTATTSVTISAAPTASISYASPFCTADTTLHTPTITGAGGSFSAPAGLQIDPGTGAIDASLSTAGTYTVTYSIAASGSCPAVSATTLVTIETPPTANISYIGPFCVSDTNTYLPTLSGTGSYTGGTFSAPPGLSINAATGAINPSLSTVGTYQVVYTIPASGSCLASNVNTSVTIDPSPTAALGYSGPFCASDTTLYGPTLTGTGSFTGGTYSAPAGLSINGATGDINPSLSTAGSYTVTYTIPASGSCPAGTAVASVVVSAPPTANIVYGGPYCASDASTHLPTLTGTGAFTGGNYSAGAGLTINATTGAIDPSLSTVGNYTVTYTVAAFGSCPATVANASVVIVAAPTAALSYTGPFCASDTNTYLPILTGTGAFTGGTFSASLGLQLDANTGAIDPSLSTAGSYIVTYIVPGTGGCAPSNVTASVTIEAPPTTTLGYAGPFCTSDSILYPPTLTGTGAFGGGIFGAPSGLAMNTTTGDINPSLSTPGTYTVTYTIPVAGSCPSTNVTTSVVIAAPASATLDYADPFCGSDTSLQAPSLTGTGSFTAGTYAAPAGLQIDTTTGMIDASLSTPGTYTVSYTIAASGSCPMVVATTNVVVEAPPTATISYEGPFCATDPTVYSPSISGTGAFSGGVFSAPSGLDLHPVTGAINPSLSTVGNYTVSYAIPASGSCPSTSVTTTVNITPPPTAHIVYNTPFCSSDSVAQAVTLTGTGIFTGGTFSSSAGLLINSTTGDIQANLSQPGTYTVTYTSPPSNGCLAVTATASIAIEALPTATIGYAGSPFCQSETIAQPVTLSGTGNYTGGVFSASFGAGIDPVTGAVTPSLIAAGMHTITYTVPASGPCPAVVVQTQIVVTALPTVSIVYNGPFCDSESNLQPVVINGTGAFTGGIFSASSGLSLNTSSGAINPSLSTPGTYTVTYTTLASGGCAAVSASTSVTITELPTATLSYAGPLCVSNNIPQAVALSGTGNYTGGTFSGTTGLNINTATGAINPSLSTTGSHTVTYTIAAFGGCGVVTATTSVLINALPTVVISYNGPFCTDSSALQNVVISGTGSFTGGIFSTTAGLNLNASTGAINPSLSTAGSYTVTYTIPASAGCTSVVATATVTITELPTVTMAYPNTPYCTNLTSAQSISLTGTAAYLGGTFLSTPGLSLNTATGAINPSGSMPGTYVVSYTTLASGNCPSVIASTSVTITEMPTATIAYDGPYCTTVTAAQAVQLSGTAHYSGGVFSAGAGLSINATTGGIRPWLSTPGTYTVTYAMPALGGCSPAPVSTTVTINATPVAVATPNGGAICTDDTTNISLTSDVPGTTYVWTVTQNNVSGATDGNGPSISQTLAATGTSAGTVTYTVVPTSPAGCVGQPLLVTVTVHPLPEPHLVSGVICRNPTTGVVMRSYVLDAGLSDADHDFVWSHNTATIPGATASTYEAMEEGQYTVVATNIHTGCVSYPVDTSVFETEVAEVAIISGNEAFIDNPVITITVIGSGDYEYQLDNGAYQRSNVFTGLTLGEHTIHVRDQDDCTDITQTFTVIGYPKFFTPNHDGYNDTWNISALADQRTSKISIFDRYGKLLKQISPGGEGWDGTLNGYPLPATDYWFVVEYLDQQIRREFKAHFALKR